MERMTVDRCGLVFYLKNGEPIPPIKMDSFDVYKVLCRLADYERKEGDSNATD